MRIVAANKFHYLRGGAERYCFDLAALLRSHGHETVPFSMRDPKNAATPWSKYFVSAVDLERPAISWQGLRAAGRLLYSFEAKRKFGALLDEAKPDIVHVHNIYHQISPSILPEAKRRGLPVVMTAHDYKLIAPNYSLFHDGAICERTKSHRYWAAAAHRCVKGSYLAGALEAVEMHLHRALGLWSRNVDRIIAPSRFMAATLAAYGVDAKKIVHVPHFVDTASRAPSFGGGGAMLYVGRLSPEKGVDALIRAAARLPKVPVRVVGDGPDARRLKELAKELKVRNVEFLGFKKGAELDREFAAARAVVVPSLWYEVFGLVALEAFAHGKPVIASQIGGLGEIVSDGATGLHVSAGSVEDLAKAMATLWEDEALTERMGKEARRVAETDYSPERHYGAIFGLYGDLLRGE